MNKTLMMGLISALSVAACSSGDKTAKAIPSNGKVDTVNIAPIHMAQATPQGLPNSGATLSNNASDDSSALAGMSDDSTPSPMPAGGMSTAANNPAMVTTTVSPSGTAATPTKITMPLPGQTNGTGLNNSVNSGTVSPIPSPDATSSLPTAAINPANNSNYSEQYETLTPTAPVPATPQTITTQATPPASNTTVQPKAMPDFNNVATPVTFSNSPYNQALDDYNNAQAAAANAPSTPSATPTAPAPPTPSTNGGSQ